MNLTFKTNYLLRHVPNISAAETQEAAQAAQLAWCSKPHNFGRGFEEPPILQGVTSELADATEETFDPFVSLPKCDSEADIENAANAKAFNLAACFCNHDIARTWRVSTLHKSGMIDIEYI